MAKDSGAVWRQIGTVPGEGGKRHGGSPCLISKDGRILAGAPKLQGKRIGSMKGEAEHGSHRSQLKAGRDYETARVRKEARAAGVDMDSLDRLAAEIQAHDKEHVAERTTVLRRAEKLAQSLGTSLRTLKARNARGIDAANVRSLDQIAHELMQEHPSQFRNFEDDPGERLLDMALEARPTAMTKAQAYREALEHLQEHGEHLDQEDEEEPLGNEPLFPEEEDSSVPPWGADDEAVPFARQGEALHHTLDDDWTEDDPDTCRRLLSMLALYVLDTISRPRLRQKAERLLQQVPQMSAPEAVRAWQIVTDEQGRLIQSMLAWRQEQHRLICSDLRYLSSLDAAGLDDVLIAERWTREW